MDKRTLLRILAKALLLFVIFNLLLVLLPPGLQLGRLSLYNHLWPGRTRLPFGEASDLANNLTLNDLAAMFAAHEVSGAPAAGEYRIFLFGDSSLWGTLLRPEETLTGQLNALGLQRCGRPARFYNLGYPTLSLTKDLLLMERAAEFRPDLTIWLVTLQSFPRARQLDSPLLQGNPGAVQALAAQEQLDLPGVNELPLPGFWERTLIGRRRAIADWFRLQAYGVRWAASGIDQYYPPYDPPQNDFTLPAHYEDLPGPAFPAGFLAWDVLRAGMQRGPVLLVNEPIFIANGKNTSDWYNFYYPIWAYDAWRGQINAEAKQSGWPMLDAWNLVPSTEFTNTAIHRTPAGEALLAARIRAELEQMPCPVSGEQ